MSGSDDRSVNVEKVARQTVDGFEGRVEDWLRARVAACADVRVTGFSAPGGTGLSGETYIISTESDDASAPTSLVLRKDVEDKQTNPQSNFDNLVTLQSVLGDMDTVPVPRVLGVEATSDLIGSPFFLMEFVSGDIPADVPSYAESGWVREATTDQRSRMWRSGLEFLVRLHGIDWKAKGLGGLRFPAEGDDDVERCLNQAVALYRSEAEGHVAPICEEAISWLRANRPSGGPECICWGDARIGNIIWRDFECVAAVDWEMGSVGCPGIDLGWWSFFHRWSTFGQGHPELEGMCVGQELADLYEACGGVRIDDFPYFELLATVRGLSIWLRTYKAMVPGGHVADALDGSVHMVKVVQALMDDVT